MTTITIKQDIALPKHEFQNAEELLEMLQNTLPLKVYQIDETEISKSSLQKIKTSQQNPDRKLTDFSE